MKHILLWLFAISIAVLAGLASIGSVAKQRAPEIALSVLPQNGFAAESLASQLTKMTIVENRGQIPDSAKPKWYSLATQAFASEPVTPEAIAIIALAQKGETRRSLMMKAFALSRRQQLVSGWLISDSAASNDIQAVLGYYDTILRTNASAKDSIMPIMVAALAQDNAVQPYAEVLSQDPPWNGSFWGQVTSTPEVLENAVVLRQVLFEKKIENSGYQDSNLIFALTQAHKFEGAKQLYVTLNVKAWDATIVRNSNFRKAPEFSPLDWQLFSTGEYGATIEGGRLNVSAISNSGGLVARQLVEIPRGRLQLKVKLLQNPPRGSRISAQISCAQKNTKNAGTVKVPITKSQTNVGVDNVRNDCDFYWLDVIARSDQDGEGFDVGIESVSLTLRKNRQ